MTTSNRSTRPLPSSSDLAQLVYCEREAVARMRLPSLGNSNANAAASARGQAEHLRTQRAMEAFHNGPLSAADPAPSSAAALLSGADRPQHHEQSAPSDVERSLPNASDQPPPVLLRMLSGRPRLEATVRSVLDRVGGLGRPKLSGA